MKSKSFHNLGGQFYDSFEDWWNSLSVTFLNLKVGDDKGIRYKWIYFVETGINIGMIVKFGTGARIFNGESFAVYDNIFSDCGLVGAATTKEQAVELLKLYFRTKLRFMYRLK